jgi:hypothetical protein
MVGLMRTEWIEPGRLLVRPDARRRDIARLVAEAEVVQFDEPLPANLSEALAEALRSRPQVELYVYGHDGRSLDGELDFLRGFEHVERLSLNLYGLAGVEGLARFTALHTLSLQGMAKRNVSVAAIEHATELQHLTVDQPVRDLEVIRNLGKLTELHSPATATALESLEGHPSLRRLSLHFGTHHDLSVLESCSQLADIELWQIRQLTAADLSPVARVKKLDALALGALRNVTTLSWLHQGSCRLRFLSVERLPALDSFEPLARCSQLVAFGAWDSRPADRRLAPLHRLPLVDLVLGDVYPPGEVDALLERCRARVRIRSTSKGGEPALHWRLLFEYADEYRAEQRHGEHTPPTHSDTATSRSGP